MKILLCLYLLLFITVRSRYEQTEVTDFCFPFCIDLFLKKHIFAQKHCNISLHVICNKEKIKSKKNDKYSH